MSYTLQLNSCIYTGASRVKSGLAASAALVAVGEPVGSGLVALEKPPLGARAENRAVTGNRLHFHPHSQNALDNEKTDVCVSHMVHGMESHHTRERIYIYMTDPSITM